MAELMLLHTAAMKPPNQKPCLVIGHRGACGYAPENTLSSIKKALTLDVDMIEFDIRLCKSGQLMLMHDDTLDRTTNTTGYLCDKTIEEITTITIDPNETIPTLQQALDTINRRAKVAIELKGPNTALPTAQIVKEYLDKGWQPDDFYIVSFDHPQLQQFYDELPQIKRCANIYGITIDLTEYARKHGFNAIGIKYEVATQELVDEVHSYDLKVFVYTVNDPRIIKQLIGIGVDGIFSNYPDRINQFLK